jgi:hypothetical protein
VTSEITPEDAAARFPNEGDLGDYARLDDAELGRLLIGAEIKHRRGIPHTRQEYFGRDGIRRVFSGYKWLRYPYVIAGDALCVEGPRGWSCRRLYRDRHGVVFQVREETNTTLEPIEIKSRKRSRTAWELKIRARLQHGT